MNINALRLGCPKIAVRQKVGQGREAVTKKNRDFASLLDDLFVAAEKPADAPPRTTIPFDYLAVAEELHSGRIRVTPGDAAAEYSAASEDIEAELRAVLGAVGVEEAGDAGEAARADMPALEELSTEPEAIAIELGLDGAAEADFGRLRRVFALKNHPDRVPPQLRQRALQRMQVANGLIDEAKRRALAKARR
ncbi:hypothetical protein ABUE31_19655 [Mesorhizobium sp. ZMM04-5]|uniref:J domain-containing protein n=1 Tax=Mesorhizobium marinum TaxID=3228790 RepID=A0ABV3R568_9HYPH